VQTGWLSLRANAHDAAEASRSARTALGISKVDTLDLHCWWQHLLCCRWVTDKGRNGVSMCDKLVDDEAPCASCGSGDCHVERLRGRNEKQMREHPKRGLHTRTILGPFHFQNKKGFGAQEKEQRQREFVFRCPLSPGSSLKSGRFTCTHPRA
jgi:hypothetical protein